MSDTPVVPIQPEDPIINDTAKSFMVGLFSNIIRNGISAVVSAMILTHPVVAQIISPATDPLTVQIIASAIAVLLVAIVGAVLRHLRHAKVVAEVWTEAAQTVKQSASRLPSVSEIKEPKP